MPEQFGQYGRHRFWEMIPGILTWGTFLLAIGTSLFIPWVAVIYIIIFDLYWVLRVLYFLIHVSAAYRKYRNTLKVNWMDEVKKIADWRCVYHVVLLPTYGESLEIIHEALHAVANSTYPNDRFIVVVGGEEGDEENFENYRLMLEKDFEGTFKNGVKVD